MELRVDGDRPVLFNGGHEPIDPDRLPLTPELAGALREWARVVARVTERGPAPEQVRVAVNRRGQQLAASVAAESGGPVDYRDPVSGALVPVAPGGAPRAGEPTPWGTGLTVSAFCAAIMTCALIVLDSVLADASLWLVLVANVVVAAGLAPTVVVTRRLPVWRWVGFGLGAGVVLGWLAWLFSLA